MNRCIQFLCNIFPSFQLLFPGVQLFVCCIIQFAKLIRNLRQMKSNWTDLKILRLSPFTVNETWIVFKSIPSLLVFHPRRYLAS